MVTPFDWFQFLRNGEYIDIIGLFVKQYRQKKRGKSSPSPAADKVSYYILEAISLNKLTTRLEKPASLSYQEMTLTMLSPITLVQEASTVEEAILPL